MRQKFSERYGFQNPRDTFQIDSIDNGLKNRIWNQIQKFYFDKIRTYDSRISSPNDFNFFVQIYDEFFKSHKKLESYISLYTLNEEIKRLYFNFEWFKVYDFIEYISEIYYEESHNQSFKKNINKVLESEMSGYRFIDNYIAPIINNVEINAIEDALNSEYTNVQQHLSRALEHLSDRENPDYINSIKESISAVESLSKTLFGNSGSTLTSCLNQLTTLDIDQHLKDGFIKLYNWTSSKDGIRHGHSGEEIKSSFAEAKFMLVACSAFVNYLIDKSNATKS